MTEYALQRRETMSGFAAALLRPVAAAGSLIRVSAGMVFQRGRGWGVWVTRSRIDFRTEVGDPATNSIVGAVVGWISRNFPEAPVRVIREDDPTAPPVLRSQSGAGRMLRLLERPNDWWSGVLMWMATIVDFVTDGNAYWYKQRASENGPVIALWWLPQKLIEPRWPEDSQSVYIGWYEYNIDGDPVRLRPTDVLHFRNGLDPDNPRKGRSALKALFREIFTDEEAAQFTASLLRNLGVPGVVISPANTTGGQRLEADPEAIKSKFMDKFGGDRRGEPLVLTAPTEVKVLSFNPQQMELRQLRRIPEERISAVLGVPAGVAGLGAGLDRNTFTNYGEANVAAYTQGIIPLQRLIAAELERDLLPEFVTRGIELFDVLFDASATTAMAAHAADIWKRAESSATKGLITRAEFKRRTGQKVTGADEVYIVPNNFVVVPAESGGVTPPRLLPAGGAEPGAVAVSEVRCDGVRTFRGGPRDGQTSICGTLLSRTGQFVGDCPRCGKVYEPEAA